MSPSQALFLQMFTKGEGQKNSAAPSLTSPVTLYKPLLSLCASVSPSSITHDSLGERHGIGHDPTSEVPCGFGTLS